jgi:hypothetical protein
MPAVKIGNDCQVVSRTAGGPLRLMSAQVSPLRQREWSIRQDKTMYPLPLKMIFPPPDNKDITPVIPLLHYFRFGFRILLSFVFLMFAFFVSSISYFPP